MKDQEHLFTSERLGFRNWQEADIPNMARVSADPDVMEFFPAPATFQQTESFIHRMQDMFAERGYCYFAADHLDTGAFIGFIGMCYQTYEAPFTPCTDIGWRLAKEHWGQGFATEGAKRCLEFAFGDIGLEAIYATAPRLNVRSVNVMKKAGMRPYLDFIHPRLPADHPQADFVCYRVQREH